MSVIEAVWKPDEVGKEEAKKEEEKKEEPKEEKTEAAEPAQN